VSDGNPLAKRSIDLCGPLNEKVFRERINDEVVIDLKPNMAIVAQFDQREAEQWETGPIDWKPILFFDPLPRRLVGIVGR